MRDPNGFTQPNTHSLLEVQEKASLLVEALPYMQRFAGERIVVKFGGHAMKSPHIQASFARDVTLLRSIGINVTVVHGGGPQIGQLLDKMQIKSDFIEGMRVTDDETMKVVQMVLMGQVNPQLVQLINQAGGRSIGLSGVDGQLLQAQRFCPNGADIGRVGVVSRVDDSELRLLGEAGFIPVIAPIGVDLKNHETLNINADYAASAIAEHMLARKLILMTDVEGIKDEHDQVISTLNLKEAEDLIKKGVIHGGMIPKLQCAFEALRSGVEKVHILDGCVKHALLLELFTDQGIGTELVMD